jgi:hypothetical protein
MGFKKGCMVFGYHAHPGFTSAKKSREIMEK